MNAIDKIVYGGGEMMHVVLRLPKQVQGQAQGAPVPHPGKGAYGFHCIFKQL
jgi:hypothetical protein